MFKLTSNISIVDLGLYISSADALIVSDFHIGYEEMMTSRGTLIPRFQFVDILKRLDGILAQIKKPLKHIIINGDLKHEFGSISVQEWRELLKLFDYLALKTEHIVIVKGNHDVKLEPIARKRTISIVDNFKIGDILITHGDAIDADALDKKMKTVIIGHEHPALGLRDKNRYEKFKCFLMGTWKRKTLIVQPSFNPLVEGTDVRRENILSPYISSIGQFDAFVVAETILPFGKLRDVPE